MAKQTDIPGYTVSGVLHEGTDTVVYRAVSDEGKPVIIKSLKDDAQGSLKAAKLSREFETLKSLGVDGVSKLNETAANGKLPLLVMEDFGGVSLAQHVRTNEIGLKEFLAIAVKIADVLASLHAKNVMHKNINPGNVLINPSTGEVRLIDFGIAARLSHEHTAAHNPNMLEGSLPYLSPEQTGRMNRTVDYRTDLYSLGITFYELLTGAPPFTAEDPMELIHCHIAKKVPSVAERNAAVPQVVCDIVARLTAKIAEDRYQSAVGLRQDLAHCHRSLTETGEVPFFTIGLHDVFSNFKIPEKLYGREAEVQRLMRCFDAATEGRCSFLLIKGSAGIGKTALVNEIHKSVLHKKGFFIAGKFEQYNAAVPFFAFRHAFADLLHYLISEPKEKLAAVKEEITRELGLNTGVLTALVPEFELLLGKQPAVPELAPAESANRLFFTLRDFIKIFATASHPLVIFLDDLQWSDDASLRLIRELVTKEVPHLFLIAACRYNELSEGHPAVLMLHDLRKEKSFEEVSLQALTEEDANALVADALLATKGETAELASLIYKRTAGNPFYVNEVLKTVYREGLVQFDYSRGRWTWDLRQIAGLKISDNVVQFMTERLKELPPACREVLELAACVGNSFKLSTLKRIVKKTASEIAGLLWPALEKELVIPASEDYRLVTKDMDFNVSYKFLHDRIRQAAYSLVEEVRLRQYNLTIGRTLLKDASEDEKKELITELVKHYNEGRSLISDGAERLLLAEMNLEAGKKAQSAVAYQSALQYFKTGIELLGTKLWETHHPLASELHKGVAQNAYQTGNAAMAEEAIGLLLHHAKTALEKAVVLSMQVRQYNTVGKPEEAIRVGLEGLRLLGYRLPENPSPLPVIREILLARWNMRGRKAASLVDAPVLLSPEKKAAARLLLEISPAAYVLGRDNLFGLAQLKIVNLSLRHGNCPESAYAFVSFGTIAKEASGNLKAAETFGRVGLAINQKLDDVEFRCRVMAAYGVLTHHFSQHWNTTSDWFRKGVEAGHLSGDLFFLAYCAVNIAKWNPALNLKESLAEQQKFLTVAKDTNYADAIDCGTMCLQVTKNLMGLTSDALSLSDAGFDEEACLAQMTGRKYSSGIGMYHIHKAEVFLANEDYAHAYRCIKEADKYVKSLLSLINLTRLCHTAFFACAGCLLNNLPLPEDELKSRMKKEWRKMKKWAKYNPVNFRHWQKLMEAEMHLIEGRYPKAAGSYEMAIALSRQNGWLSDEAYANERTAKFYLRGSGKAAAGYWAEAYRLYQKWGAEGKLKFLEKAYPEFFSSLVHLRQGSAVKKDDEGSEALDVATIIKSSQAISGEIELKALLGKMMHIIVMNAGAENGMLLLEDEGRLYVQASTDGTNVATMQNIPADETELLPRSVINYAFNLKVPVVLDNAFSEGEFTNDDYIAQRRPKSVLCSPVVLLNKLYGLVYLENNLSVGAFTEDRLNVVNLLSSQMAISIQNAQLYANLEKKVQERTVELRAEKKKSDDLLMNILPQEVADELKQTGTAEAKQFEEVTVLFTDFVDFTKISVRLTAKELVEQVHRYFTAFDAIIERNGLEKIKTIGDAYLAVAGLPHEDPDHARRAADAALEIVDYVNRQRATGALFDIRVGLNSGPVIAGIVGSKKFAYDVWGDTVNTASRMETASEGSRVNLSAATYKLLADDYVCEYRGFISAKNKGMIEMYFLEGKKEGVDIGN